MNDPFQLIPPDLAALLLAGVAVFVLLFHPELFN